MIFERSDRDICTDKDAKSKFKQQYRNNSTQLRHVKLLDSLHFIRKSLVIAQKKSIIMELLKVASSQIFLLLLNLSILRKMSILRKTIFLRHFDDESNANNDRE